MSVCHLFRADSNNFSLLQTHPNIGPRTALLSHTSCLLAPPDSLLLGPLLSGTNLRSQLLCPAVGTHSCPQLPEFMPLQAGPEPACLAHHHIGTLFSPHGFMRLVPRYSEHTHTCMYWAKSPGDPPPLGWLANGYNLILVEPFHCKPVQGLVSTVRRDRWSEEPTSTIPLSPHPCSPDLQSPLVTLS